LTGIFWSFDQNFKFLKPARFSIMAETVNLP
jgi:hypothetical protein